jgi:hypothetical protein
VITAAVDLKELERDLVKTAAMFGEANETGIARWGVAICRRLVTETQVWGDGKAARLKHEGAMIRDARRVAIVVKYPEYTVRVESKRLTGLRIKGKIWKFRPEQNLTTAQGLNDWIELNRTSRTARPPKKGLPEGVICITTGKVVTQAMKQRFKRIGKAKGGWIGAGQGIGKFQKKGSRLTIGKNVASFAHKHKSGGTASMKRDTWNPEGKITNSIKHASDPHVLRQGQAEEAVIDAAKNTIAWYKNAIQGRLNRKR